MTQKENKNKKNSNDDAEYVLPRDDPSFSHYHPHVSGYACSSFDIALCTSSLLFALFVCHVAIASSSSCELGSAVGATRLGGCARLLTLMA